MIKTNLADPISVTIPVFVVNVRVPDVVSVITEV